MGLASAVCWSLWREDHTMGNRSTHRWCATWGSACSSSMTQVTCGWGRAGDEHHPKGQAIEQATCACLLLESNPARQ